MRSSRRMRFASVTCEKTCVIFLIATFSLGREGLAAAHTSPSAAWARTSFPATQAAAGRGQRRTGAPPDMVLERVALLQVRADALEELEVLGLTH